MELLDAGLAGLAHVAGGRVRIDVVGIDLEGDQAQCVQRRRLDDRHVVRGLDGRAGEVGAGAGAGVGEAGEGAIADRGEETAVVEGLQQAERVATAAEDGLGGGDGAQRICRFVQGIDGVADPGKGRAGAGGVAVLVLDREGNEQDAPDGAQEGAQLGEGVLEPRRAMDRRGA